LGGLDYAVNLLAYLTVRNFVVILGLILLTAGNARDLGPGFRRDDSEKRFAR
jgi:hypothetical protein